MGRRGGVGFSLRQELQMDCGVGDMVEPIGIEPTTS
jgi:hypothetical protein